MPSFPFRASLVFLLSAALAAAVLVVSNWHILQTEMLPFLDAGADELRVDQASRGRLLVGHYSRFGFSHPGPFFFYFRAIWGALLGRYFPGPYNAHVAALLCLNGCFIGLAAMAAYGLGGRGRAGWLAAISTLAVVLYQFHRSGSGLVSSWMPDVVRMPYFAFLLQLLLLARGSGTALIAATFCAAAAVHGYVVMPFFVVGPWLVAAAYGHFSLAVANFRWSKAALAGAGVIALIFATPMALDRLLHSRDNIDLILTYLRHQNARDPNPIGTVTAGISAHWGAIQPLLWTIPLAAVLLDAVRLRTLRCWAPVSAMTAMSVALFAVYLRRVADPAYAYIGYFHESVPLALVAFGAIRIATHADGFPPARAGIFLICTIALVMGGGRIGFVGAPEIRDFSQAVMQATPRRDVVLEIGDYDQWGVVAGVMVDLERFGLNVCTPPLPFGLPEQSLTSERICGSEASDWPRFSLVDRDSCWPDCVESNRLGSLTAGGPAPGIINRGSLPWDPESMVRLAYRRADDLPAVRKLLHDLRRIGVRTCSAAPQLGQTADSDCPQSTPGTKSILARVVRTTECRGACIPLPAGRSLEWIRLGTARISVLQLDFSEADAWHHLGRGWSRPEAWGVWTDGDQADLVFDRDAIPGSGNVEMVFDFMPYVPIFDRSLDIHIDINGKSADEWSIDPSATPVRHTLFIPEAVLAEQTRLKITFKGIGGSSPARDGLSHDGRRLGIGMYRLALYRDQE